MDRSHLSCLSKTIGINKPEILLADEPTGALDSHNGAEIMTIFQTLNKAQGITIVMVTYSDEIAAYAGRIIRFRDGLIVGDAKVAKTGRTGCASHLCLDCGSVGMKQLISSIRIAFRALRMNKLRSALTMLGIVIGVASVMTRDILTQFLVEAITLSLAGGVAGILVGVGASLLISTLAGWTTSIGPGAVLLAVFFSAVVGVGFGYYPARKAAFLDPIEALRYD